MISGTKRKDNFNYDNCKFISYFFTIFLADLSGSVGLAANAWHSFSDVFVSSVVLVGIFIARLGAKKYIKAFEKFENILALFVSLFIFFMGFEVWSDALGNEGTELKYVPFVAAGAFVGIVINYFMARYKIYVGEQTRSQSLVADGYHSKMDMYCSIAVLVGIIGSLFGMNSLDKIAALVAMIFLVASGYEIFSTNLKSLVYGKQVGHEGHHHGHMPLSGKSKKRITFFCLIFIGAYFLSGVYFVKLNEVGIMRTFGSITKENISPGIHYKLPYPFEEVSLIEKDTIRKLEVGSQELLTGDTNLINVTASVQYKVTDAVKYSLNVNNLDVLIKAATTTSIREIIGSKETDYLLTTGRTEVQQTSKQSLQNVLDRNNTGIEVVGVQLLNISPPSDVMASFQDLASARQDKAVYINEAQAYWNTLIPKAKGEAYKAVKTAEGYTEEKIKMAEGDATLFTQRLSAYQNSKKVTEFRLYMESMDKILPNVQKILLGGNIKINNADLWINNNDNGGIGND